jgi:mono/diheme cytochrome c family protein/glucose/arabinose dehydrogenase
MKQHAMTPPSQAQSDLPSAANLIREAIPCGGKSRSLTQRRKAAKSDGFFLLRAFAPLRETLLLIVLATLLIAGAPAARTAQSAQQDEMDNLAPGLLAALSAADGSATIARVDPDVQFDWGESSPDLRVSAERFQAVWRGSLSVPGSRKYRFHLFTVGKAAVSIAGRKVIDGTTDEPRWLSSDPIELEQGDRAIEVRYSKTGRSARIGLYWESSAWPLEPVTPRWLFHEPLADSAIGRFEHGHDLVRAYRCAACHEMPGADPPRRAPSLAGLPGRVHPAWLIERLAGPHAAADQPVSADSHSRMPVFGLTLDQSRAVAAYLLKGKTPAAATETPKARPDVGENLVRSLGCLACHTFGESGHSGLFGGGSLDRIAEKRPAQFFRDWLRKPEQLNTDHRMPVFNLNSEEVGDIAAFLSTLGKPKAEQDGDGRLGAAPSLLEAGKRVLNQTRCAACHEIPGIDRAAASRIDLQKVPSDGCLGEPDVARNRPGYRLNQEDRAAVREFVGHLPTKPAALASYEVGRRLLREANCLSCHARDLDRGLQPATVVADKAGDQATELAKLRGELEPPSLSSVGDKFTDEALAKLIHGGLPARRPWLKVRMPRYAHSDADRDAILAFLIDHDRIPLGVRGQWPAVGSQESQITDLKSQTLDPAAALTAGHHLVSSRGFGCMSCHTVGKHEPKGVAVNARGSDLLAMGGRLRHEWFLRWTRDPARIVPGMEMPAITVPAPGVLDGRLDRQLEALWQSLNSPAFVVPSDRDTAQQIISLKPGDAPVILRDVMYDCPPGSGWCPRAFAIGFPNRHNILFDLDTMSLRGWWFGDFARQRTAGKSWLWEPGGLPVWDKQDEVASIALRHRKTGRIIVPNADVPNVGRLRNWRCDSRGVELSYELHFEGDVSVDVVEHIEPGANVGFHRNISVRGTPDGYYPIILQRAASDHGGDRLSVFRAGPLGQTEIRINEHVPFFPGEESSVWQRVELAQAPPPGESWYALAFGQRWRGGHIHLAYLARGLAGEGSSSSPAANQPNSSTKRSTTGAPASAPRENITLLPIAQGYDVVRLKLDASVMPIAIAFRPNGTPVVCSLKGQIFLAHDPDGGGFEETWQPFSDHLAAPYGLLADGNDILVSHKPELLRLEDRDGDGRADHNTVVASGWGYNEDYHDWTFGVLRDSASNIYIATANDYAQKDRPKSARGLRGQMLKVSPDGRLETLARGLRYPTGLAMNRHGGIFFTDNQGVQNTFNEINHLVPGSRYGVPAQDDPPADQDPWPLRSPAIQIPHPWTRSVNGICFLESGGKWGPFEGHGIGCEYDTRGLIRFSLQKIGDAYQGACYPFTLPEDQVPQDRRLLGPICCAVSPNGDLYVGGIRDSGWGGGSNVGELVRIRPAAPPVGVREVRATRDGFVIDFTAAVDATAAANPTKFVIASYRRIWKGAYATPDSDRRTEQIRRIDVAADGRSVSVTLSEMRPGFVYDIHVGSIGRDGTALWPADAYYTLNQIPDE